MNWKRKVFDSFKLYGITDIREESPDILRRVEQAYAGGTDIVQLRSKTLSDAALYRLGLKIRKIADRKKKLFFVNDRLDLAMVLQADGVHLGQDDLPVAVARKALLRAGIKMWIGKSTHSIQQSFHAEKEKVDYIGVGPVFKTPTKPGYRPAGLQFVREASSRVKIPMVMIGGIDLTNIETVLAAGARRIAVVRALFAKENSYEAARNIKEKIENFN